MRAWIIELSEPLPFEDGRRVMRCGRLWARMQERGHDVVWWTSDFDHYRKQARPFGASVRCGRGSVELLRATPYRRNVSLQRILSHRSSARNFAARASTAVRPDIIYACMPTIEVAHAAAEHASRFGVPLIVDVRDVWPDAFVTLAPKPLRGIAHLAIEPFSRAVNRLLRQATGVVAVSAGYLDWALARAQRAPSAFDAVFPLGYTLPPSKAVESPSTATLERLRDAVVCLFVGSFGQTYDLDTVIRVASRLHEQGRSDVHFVFVGDGERGQIWRRSTASLANVTFTGWLGAAEIAGWLNRADIGLAAYATDAPQSLPNKAFEYFAAGLPILSSIDGELGSLLAQAQIGLVYRGGDAASLYDRIDELLRDPDRRRAMGARAQLIAQSRFDAEQIATNMACHLEKVVAAATRASVAVAAQ